MATKSKSRKSKHIAVPIRSFATPRRPKPKKNLSDSQKAKKVDRLAKLRKELDGENEESMKRFNEIDKLRGDLGI